MNQNVTKAIYICISICACWAFCHFFVRMHHWAHGNKGEWFVNFMVITAIVTCVCFVLKVTTADLSR